MVEWLRNQSEMVEWLRNQSRALSIVSIVKSVNKRSYSSPGARVRNTSCGWKTKSLKKKWWSQNNNYIPETYWIFTTLNNSLEHSTTNCIQLRWPQSLKKCSEPSSGSASIIINQYLSMSTSTMAVLNLKACLECANKVLLNFPRSLMWNRLAKAVASVLLLSSSQW